MSLIIPKDYKSSLGIIQTQQAIKDLKDFFEQRLGEVLKLTRVSSPLLVLPETGTNDNLNGIEKAVSFEVPDMNKKAEIVQSLAKWKRIALKKYGFSTGRGLYTDMNAIRKDEELDNIHSIYVDQWDWEVIIDKEERNIKTLKDTVIKIYDVFKETEERVHEIYPEIQKILPEEITFITSHEFLDMYTGLNPKEREDAIERLDRQLRVSGCDDRREFDYHKALLNGELPYTIGGGIGQSRICMYFLNKAHIGEVQVGMNAIRKDEELDNIHSIYVDQWDWEVIIDKEERNIKTLKDTVIKIYDVFKETEERVHEIYPEIKKILPEEITFITSQELLDMYPGLNPKEREDAIVREKGAVFIMQIGKELTNGKKHDGRSPDYDDWDLNGDILFYNPVLDNAIELSSMGIRQIGKELTNGKKHDGRSPDYDDWDLNGDILFYNPVLDNAIELSSMGIRVDEESLDRQLRVSGCDDRREFDYHKALLNGELPYTIGGGIGQSRICMYFLNKAHIGEVQVGIWPNEMVEKCSENGIDLL